MKIAVLVAILFASTLAKKVYFCEVPVESDLVAPTISLRGSEYGWDNFNFITFGDFACDQGDVQGRLAVRGNMNVKAFTVGYELITAGVSKLDEPIADSLVAGGNVKYNGGSTHPDGSGIPYAGAMERYFIGGTSATSFDSTQASVPDRDTTSNAAEVISDFDDAKAYYIKLSNAFAALPVNGAAKTEFSGLWLTCDSNEVNVFSVTPKQISSITYYDAPSCKGKTLIINIRGAGTIKFQGDDLRAINKAERILFNVPDGNTIQVPYGAVWGNLLAPTSSYYQPTSVHTGFIVTGNAAVDVNQINRVDCNPPSDDPTPVPSVCVGFEKTCTGLTNSYFSFLQMNVISFGDFKAESGDVEGRLAVAGSCSFGTGYTVGHMLSTAGNSPDRHADYSLVCGKSLSWTSGALYPQGNNFLAVGAEEKAFVSGPATVPADMTENQRIVSDSTQATGVAAAFAAGRKCYESYQADLAALTENVQTEYKWNGQFITCNDANANQYVIRVTASQLNSATYTVTDKCNFQARWVINVVGSDDVTFTGATFPAIPGGVIYNVVGTGRTINVHDTLLGGHLLAPGNTLNQVSGVIVGKVVVGDVKMSLQINREDTCPNSVTITKPLICSETAAAGVLTAKIAGANDFRIGDRTGNGEIEHIDGDYVTFSFPITNGCTAGQQIGTVKVDSTSGRGIVKRVASTPSSASSAVVAAAALAAAAMMI